MPEHPLFAVEKLDPEIVRHVRDIDGLIYGSGALPRKIKLLIAMAFDAAQGASRGVAALIRAAVKEGATKEEIAEALRVAYHLAGVGTLYTASDALREVLL